MITDKSKTPVEIFVQENMSEKIYGINQDDTIDGMVRYVREDFIPNEEEMLAFAEKETFRLDDRLCPYDREELRSRAWLGGYWFAKKHQEIKVRNVYKAVELPIKEQEIPLRDFMERFSCNSPVWVENKKNITMYYKYRADLEPKDGPIMDWELKYTSVANCNVIRVSSVLRKHDTEAYTVVVDTEDTCFTFLKGRVSVNNAPFWLYKKVHGLEDIKDSYCESLQED